MGPPATVTGAGRVERFFFDRNLGRRVPAALRGDGWAVELHDDHFDQDTVDEAIFPVVAARGWVLVTQDKRIRRRPAERLALIEFGVRTFSIASTANLSASATIDVLSAAKPGIDEVLATLPAPFVVAVYKDGSLSRLDLGEVAG